MGLKDFRTYHTAMEFYRLCEGFDCPNHLQDQLLRASSSIAANLSEGSAKPTAKDRSRYYYIALGSLRECQTLLALAKSPKSSKIASIADHLGAQIFKLCESQKSTKQTPPS